MRKIALAAFALLGLGAAPAPAHAWTSHGGGGGWSGGSHWSGSHWGGGWHGHTHTVFFFGGGPFFWGGYPYWYGYPYYAPPVVVQQAPQVYVQPADPAQQYWYYCQNPPGYYPSVGECPSGWVRVVPSVPPGAL